jgi:hypothetical protein
MAKAVKVTLNPGLVATVVGGQTKEACRNAANTAKRLAEGNIRSAGRIDTGEMIGGIVVEDTTRKGMVAQFTVTSTAPHSMFQEAGTRAHGPRRAKMLAWTPKGGGPMIFAKWVRGVTALHFMENAAKALKPGDFHG